MSMTPNGAARDLIFDIGLHGGEDAAYYLHLGYSVVGIEANPLLTAKCARRFEAEIRQGRMKVVNAGVLAQAGEFTFYRNLSDDGWSSFEPEMGMRGGKWEELKIPTVTTEQLIAQYGKPFFMKVDIEGADFQALQSIRREIAPAYVSLELDLDDKIVERLIDLGYSAFKFVHGGSYRPTPPIFEHQIGWRFLRKAGRMMPLVRSTVSKLPERIRAKNEFDPPDKYSPDGYPFSDYSSGPFGEKAAGPWLSSKAALNWISAVRGDYRRAGRAASFWWDVHARHSLLTPAADTLAK